MATQDQFSKMYDVEVIGGNQSKRLAEMLRANALNQPQGQMVSGWYVPPSWSQNLNQALQTGLGAWGGVMADREEQEALQKDLALLSGKPTPQQLAQAVRPQPQQPTTTPLPEGDVTPEAQVNPVGMALPEGRGGVQVSPQVNLQQPQGMPDYRQFQSPQIRNMMLKKHIESLTPEYSQTPQYDQSGRAFVLDKAGNMKYLGTDQAPVRKMSDFNEPFVMNEQGQWVPNKEYQQYSMTKSRAGAANVNVNTGQRGFDNTLKLRSDFRSEPTYKAFQEVQSAWDKVRTSSERATPASDLATATKFMKILDEGSVVRESELGLALAATGVEDKLKNYANNIITGQKLNPAQRKDFRETAQLFYNEAAKRYNGKRNEYADIAGRNQLNVEDVVGPEVKLPKQVVRTGRDRSGRTVYQYSDGSTGYGN